MFIPLGPIYKNPLGLDIGSPFRISRLNNSFGTVFGVDYFKDSENISDGFYHYIFTPFTNDSSIGSKISLDLFLVNSQDSKYTKVSSINFSRFATVEGSVNVTNHKVDWVIYHPNTNQQNTFFELVSKSNSGGASVRFFPPPADQYSKIIVGNVDTNNILAKILGYPNDPALLGLYNKSQIVYGYKNYKSPNDNSPEFAGYDNYTIPTFQLPIEDYNAIEIALYDNLALTVPSDIITNKVSGIYFTLRIRQATVHNRHVSWWSNIMWLSDNGDQPDLFGPRLTTIVINFEYDPVRNLWLGDALAKY